MKLRSKFALTAPLVLLLASCGDDAAVPETSNDAREASGEILEGSVSDAMLPLAETRSQAPLRAEDPRPVAAAPRQEDEAPTPEVAPEPAAAPEPVQAEPAASPDVPQPPAE